MLSDISNEDMIIIYTSVIVAYEAHKMKVSKGLSEDIFLDMARGKGWEFDERLVSFILSDLKENHKIMSRKSMENKFGPGRGLVRDKGKDHKIVDWEDNFGNPTKEGGIRKDKG